MALLSCIKILDYTFCNHVSVYGYHIVYQLPVIVLSKERSVTGTALFNLAKLQGQRVFDVGSINTDRSVSMPIDSSMLDCYCC